MNNIISTLNTEVENAQAKTTDIEAQYSVAQEQIATLSTEVEDLRNYKKSIEDKSKETVIAEYTNKLSEDILDSYREKMAEYTVEDLDMHLAYELKKTNASVFGQMPEVVLIPKEGGKSGIEKILDRYKI